MAAKKNQPKDPEKTVDLPPHGSHNPDPITDQAGSHPIETGVGAAVGGAATGAALGLAVSGPLAPAGVVVGAIAGAVAGGLAGKGVGELIDPTTEDNWLREYFASDKAKAHVREGDTHETYRPAYRYGVTAGAAHAGKRFDDVEEDLRSGWEREYDTPWAHARGAVNDAFDRTIRLHEEQLKVDKTREKTGEVEVRKEVKTEHKKLTVPVEREEVVIERRAVNDRGGSVKAEEIRIPVSEEKVKVTKETVAKEEVSVGKRKVTDNKTVEADVRHEELEVDQEGQAKVKQNKKK